MVIPDILGFGDVVEKEEEEQAGENNTHNAGGNMGGKMRAVRVRDSILELRMVLRWVYENIKYVFPFFSLLLSPYIHFLFVYSSPGSNDKTDKTDFR